MKTIESNKTNLYSDSCYECSKLITNRYSTSFSLGIRLFESRLRAPIYAVYGFVRFADEIVDTFHSFNKADLLEKFKKDAFEAIQSKISLNPILHAFQEVVNKYHIERELIDAFLESMEMDLKPIEYSDAAYKKYIYGSAEVVGLMCLRIFCEGNEEQYQSLKESACSLGAAFQKVNFLRDIKSDYEERGRVYFPGIDYNNFTDQDKRAIEADIKQDFDNAYLGIIRLPKGARLGVYLAFVYYTNLLKKINRKPAEKLSNERVRVSDRRKLLLLCNSAIRHRLNIM